MKTFKKGDYVLATKWSDGDPKDHFAVGFFDRMLGDRYIVVDADGTMFRAGGFRRIAKISAECGTWMVKNISLIEQCSVSVWFVKRRWKMLRVEWASISC